MSLRSHEDPFEMFGEDDDDDDDDDEVNAEDRETYRISRSMVHVANQGSEVGALSSIPASRNEDSSDRREEQRCMENTPLPDADSLVLPWTDHPLYLGPMKLVSRLPFGGGRGYVASEALAPGLLMLVEEPIILWPAKQLGKKLDLVSLLHIVQHPEASRIIHQMEHLHPTKEAVDGVVDSDEHQVGDMVQRLHFEYNDNHQLKDLVELSENRGIVNADGTLISKTDILRLLLTLRYNGLESGLYLHVAMLNHSDQPNCVKFLPENDKQYSEVRTTRAVRIGEPLTISYLPRIVSHASRRKHLKEQHRFDIGANLAPGLRKMELIGNNLPSSSPDRWNENSTTLGIEKAAAELEGIYRDVTAPSDTIQLSPIESEQVKALEQASLELFTEARDRLQNEHHLLLIPCLKLHLDSCDLVLRQVSLTPSQRVNLLVRLVVTAKKLLSLQLEFHGHDHFDLARTNQDLSQAVEELLAKSPKQLISQRLEGLATISAWATLEHRSRMEFARVKALYPHDAEQHFSEHQINGTS